MRSSEIEPRPMVLLRVRPWVAWTVCWAFFVLGSVLLLAGGWQGVDPVTEVPVSVEGRELWNVSTVMFVAAGVAFWWASEVAAVHRPRTSEEPPVVQSAS